MPKLHTPTAECYIPFLNAVAHPACVFQEEIIAKNDAWGHLDQDDHSAIVAKAVQIRKGQERFKQGYLHVNVLADESLFVQYVKDESEYLLYSHAIKSVTHEALVILEELKIINCNERFISMFDLDGRESALHTSISKYITEIDLDRMRLSILGTQKRMEIRARDSRGKLMFLEVTAAESRIQEKQVLILAINNVSARKRAEQSMFQSKELYRSLIENSPTGIFILRDKHILFANLAGTQLLGALSEDEIYNSKFSEFVEGSSRAYVDDLLNAARNGEEVDFEEINLVNLDAKLIKVELRASLTVYDGKPSLQITLHNLSLKEELMQERTKGLLTENLNAVMKKELEDHKATQVRLRAARNFTRSIIDSSIDMIMAVNTKGEFTEFNKAALNKFNISKDQAKDYPLSKLFKKQEDVDAIQKRLNKTGKYIGEIEALSSEGEGFTCFLSASLLRGSEGEIVGSMAIARDVTLIKKAELQLRKSEERYRDIYENATDFIYSVGFDGTVRYVNDAMLAALGYSAPELKKLDFRELVVYPEVTGKDFFKSLAGKNVEITLRGKEGKEIIAEGNSSIKYKEKKAMAIRSIMRDVTEQRQSLRYAMEQKAKLESILNSTENIMMCTLDRAHNITSFNTNFAETMIRNFDVGFTFGDSYSKLLKSIVNPDLYQRQLDVFDRAFKGEAQQFELPVLNAKNENAWLMHFLNPIKVDENSDEYDEISVLCYDVTDRKEIDRKIRDSLREKEVLLQEVHHRVKNNLQVISSILNLQSGYVKDEKTLEILEESQNRIKSMSFIHETLYQTNDFGQIEFGEYIQTIARNLLHSYSMNTGKVELVLDVEKVQLSLNQSIPCGLIVNELVSNTLKYAFPDGRDGKLFVSIKEKGNELELSVSDNGIGLPKEFKYQESDSLGVQLVYALSEQLDATIDLDSSEGTAFIFRFIKQ